MSFRMQIDPMRHAAALFIGTVRDELLRALVSAKESSGLTQSELARKIGVHRSVVNRELAGHANLTLRRVAELACAMGYTPVFDLVPTGTAESGCNFAATQSSRGQTIVYGSDQATRSDSPVLASISLAATSRPGMAA